MANRIAFTFLILLISVFVKAQNRHFSIGRDSTGICFGNASLYNGLRLNLWDNNTVHMNGINISGLTQFRKFNGLSVGIIGAADTISNGIEIGGLAFAGQEHNGLAVGPVVHARKINGVGIGIITEGDTLNGFFFGIIGTGALSSGDENAGRIKGVAMGTAVVGDEMHGVVISSAGNEFEELHGVSFGFYNNAKELHGIQFGLINHAGNNRGPFKWTPLFNFHFKR